MRTLGLAVTTALLIAACSAEDRPASGLMLVLDTDMAVPATIDEVGLYVQQIRGTQTDSVLAQKAKPIYDPATDRYSVTFSTTLALQADTDQALASTVRTRFVAFGHDGSVVAMREARSKLPTGDVRALALPLLFINSGRVQDTQAGVTTNAAGVGVADIGPDDRSDPFTRFRHPECQDDQTLDDDGACAPIDVVLEDLPPYEPPSPDAGPQPCFDPTACFGGTRGVRTRAIDADCTVSLEGLGGSAVALALRTPTGYDVDGAPLQPVNGALYTVDAASERLTLKPALCARAKGLSEVVVSAKCAPKADALPICGRWRAGDAAPTPPTTAGFPGDAPQAEPDASTADGGSDADAPPDGGDASDAGEDAEAPNDAGPDAATPEPQSFDIALDLDTNTYDALVSFAATHDPSAPAGTAPAVWLWMNGTDGESYRVQLRTVGAGGPAQEVSGAQGLPNDGHFELGADLHAYVQVSGNDPDFTTRYVLPRGSTSLAPLAYDDAAGAPQPDQPVSHVSFSAFHGATLAVHEPNLVSNAQYVARRPKTAQGDLFDYTPLEGSIQGTDSSWDQFGLGAILGDSFFVPAPHYANALLRVEGGLAGAPLVLSSQTMDLEAVEETSYALQSLVALGNGEGVAVARNASDSTPGFYRVVVDAEGNPSAPLAPFFTVGGGRVRHEVFGGAGTLCARIENDDATLYEIVCGRPGGANQFQFFYLVPFGESGDVHISGDADYLYAAKLCYDAEALPTFSARVVAVPWAQVDAVDTPDLMSTLDSCVNPPPTQLP